MSKNQLFVITGETWDALTPEEVSATASAMQELGIFKLPYPCVDVWLEANSTVGWNYTSMAAKGEITKDQLKQEQELGLFELNEQLNQYKPAKGSGFVFEIRNLKQESSVLEIAMHAEPQTLAAKFYLTKSTPVVKQDVPILHDKVVAALIVLLGTRNVLKTTKENKLLALGIGKNNKNKPSGQYRYVTTISLPKVLETTEGEGAVKEGCSKAPHLRRGHIRSQHYGPKGTFVKQIWIEPVFVNADKQWVQERERYNVSL